MLGCTNGRGSATFGFVGFVSGLLPFCVWFVTGFESGLLGIFGP